ncbi:MAG: DUF1800 domain-containing protein [Phycisphaerales bacterium]|nr:DUF1800 domain-containing protein [Phycisphaerales bacterium]
MPTTNSTTTQPRRVVTSLSKIRDEDFGYAQARHLLLRAGFGGTDEQIRTLVQWGPEAAVDHLLNFEEIPADADRRDAFDHNIIHPRTTAEQQSLMRARQSKDEDVLAQFRTMRQKAQRADRTQMREIQRWWFTRMIQSPRPLQEKLTLFWHGHFATSFRITEDSYHMYSQNRMFRANAAGNFADLLRAIIRDPAMLKYLNNNQNRKSSPNENFAREIMELFSLGEGNYSERDIKDGAKALTGFTFRDDAFYFNKNGHDNNTKQVLGMSGNFDADGFVNAILFSPACAPFICAKIYKFFVADIPTDVKELTGPQRTVVRNMSSMLQDQRYALKPILRRLFLSRHFYDASVMGNKIKSPLELVVGAVRTLNVPIRHIPHLTEAMDMMGQSIFLPPSVKGWDGGRSWINTSTMYVRQNTLAYMLTGHRINESYVNRNKYNPTNLVAAMNDPRLDNNPPPMLIANQLLDLVLGSRPEGAAKILVDAANKVDKPNSAKGITTMLLLITSMPEYQLC